MEHQQPLHGVACSIAAQNPPRAAQQDADVPCELLQSACQAIHQAGDGPQTAVIPHAHLVDVDGLDDLAPLPDSQDGCLVHEVHELSPRVARSGLGHRKHVHVLSNLLVAGVDLKDGLSALQWKQVGYVGRSIGVPFAEGSLQE